MTFGFLVPLSKDKHCIRYKCVFKLKYNVDNSVDKYKAQMVVKGYI